MTLSEARLIIADPSSAFARQVEAAAVIAGSKNAELADLLRCLRLSGLPAEQAAVALYQRTGRPYSGRIEEFSADPDEWAQYLARQLQAAAG